MDKTFDVIYGTSVFKSHPEETLYETLRKNGIVLRSACGGTGRCGKCKIQVQGDLSEPDDFEKNTLSTADLARGIRLACRVKARGHLRIERIALLESQTFAIPDPFCAIDRQKIEEGDSRVTTFEKPVNWESEAPSDWAVMLQGDDPVDSSSDLLKQSFSPALAAYLSRKLPRLLLSSRITELYLDDRIRDLLSEEESKYPRYFLAVDIGTTTLTLYLLDSAGNWKGGFTAKNPQIPFGTDVISRVSHSLTPGGSEELRNRLTEKIDQMIQEVKRVFHISPEQIICVGLVGNTCMQQLFWGILPYRLGKSPFRAFTTELLSSNAVEAHFYALEAHTPIIFLPSVAGYVGSDALAGALWCDLDLSQKPYLYVDIGTNGEIMLNQGDEILCCSAAAGPALEGMNISCGMPGVEGAISHVYTGEEGGMRYAVIGNGPPKGICGSGLISLIAWLLQHRILKPNGAYEKHGAVPEHLKSVLWDERGVFRWSIRGDSHDIFLDQQDVRQFQLAKGAIRCGIEILLETSGLGLEDLDRIYLSGSFGNALDRQAAVATGLLPPVDSEKIIYVGNAACKGLSLWLTRRNASERLEILLKRMRSIRLENHPNFSDLFCRSMRLGDFS
ncbi:MAG: DUF4445 domain-containing protein [Thermotogaceae bacterium]|nr:DUF4445 domain-containing protein [Thermotogaceae bacterium]